MQPNSLSLIMIFSAMFSLFLALFAYKNRKTPAMLSLSLLLVAATVWALGYGLELAAANLQSMKIFTAFAYLGIATIPVFWLIFVARYTGNDGWLSSPTAQAPYLAASKASPEPVAASSGKRARRRGPNSRKAPWTSRNS